VASNGGDYLGVWGEVPLCSMPCTAPPVQLYAMRLRADGTAIDTDPLRLDDGNTHPNLLTAGWADGIYLVAWSDGQSVRGTRISAEGRLLDGSSASAGVLLDAGSSDETLIPTIAALGKQFILLLRRSRHLDGTSLEGLTFGANVDLSVVASLPRTVLLSKENAVGSAAAAAHTPSLLVVYSRIGAQEAGGVSRAFLRLFQQGATTRHRAVLR
jgi:hypothetical protein